MNHQEYLRVIDQIIEKGPYSATWESLSRHMTPQWYQDAKFGIFIHWGVFSVPERASEWHLRNMHVKGQTSYQIHREKYGEPKAFGYHDLIPLFKRENFDPDAWAALFQNSGAKFVMPVAEHHDGFQMYDSDLSKWCAAKMGPVKDILGLLKTAIEKRDMTFCTSSHRAEHYWFANGSPEYDSGVPQNPERDDLYWPNRGRGFKPEQFHDITILHPEEDFLDDWLVRTCDLIDIVNKNGALLLNVGPRADGRIPDEDRHILEEIGKWLAINGEAIYGTRYWKTFGEGPTRIKSGYFCDTDRSSFTSEDIRFTASQTAAHIRFALELSMNKRSNE